MKTNFLWLRCVTLLAALLGARAFAQQEPIIGVDITGISVVQGSGGVADVVLSTSGSGYTTPPAVTFSGGGGSGAAATATIANGAVTSIMVTNSGSNYTTSPTITIAAPGTTATATAGVAAVPGPVTSLTPGTGGSGYTTAPAVTITGGGGTGAAATATVTNGQVSGLTLTAGGTGYTSAPTVTIAPPGAQATAYVRFLGTSFNPPFQNESYGAYNTPILIKALAHGTYPADGYSYEYFVNGTSLGIPVPSPTPAGVEGIIAWSPPQPGAYLLTVKASDGAHTATSLAVRYFATGTSIIGPVENTLVPVGSSVVIQATAVPPPVGTNAFVQRVEFYIDGTLRGTDYTYPYSLIYTPEASPATHTIEARAFDNNGNQVSANGAATRGLKMVTPIGTPPTVRILNPVNGTSVSAGGSVDLIADATAPTGFIKNVDFYVNGVALSSSQTFPFKATWTSQVPGRYEFVAIGFDDKSNAVASTPITVYVTGGFPTVAITNPPVTGATVIQGTKLSVAVTAAGSDGGIASLQTLELLVDGNVAASLPENPTGATPPPPLTEPFVFTWRSNVALGQHRLSSRVTDNRGLKITSAEIPITVIANQLPSVSLTSPEAGGSYGANSAITISAAASDPDGSIDSVEFFVNGTSLGAPVTKSPYQWTWTPSAAGPYSLTAKATDNAGAVVATLAIDVTITAATTGSSGGGGVNTVYRGDYGSPTESGHFTFALNRNGRGTFMGYSTSPAGKIYYWTDFPVSTDGTFSVTDSTGVVLSGQTSSTGVAGTFGNKTFIGMLTIGSVSPIIMTGGLNGDSGSSIVAVVGADNTITVYSASGTKRDVGTGIVTSAGTYTATSANGTTYSGTVVPSTSMVSGSLGGTMTGSFVLQQQPSRLMNLSTRALAGTGDRTLVAGFVVRGSGTKPLLVRAVGPTLANYGVTGTLANPSLSVVNPAGTALAANDDWNNAAAIASLSTQVGAFPLLAGSKDGAVSVSLAPGVYSAVVGGATTTGNALIEIYDTEAVGSTNASLSNLSSRALLNSGDTLIAGFVIGGDVKKKLLIRAVGPTLASFGITNAFDDPKLDILSGTTSVGSNDNWSTNATAALSTATTQVKAFPLNAGSKDAAMVVTLSPGSYTVHVTGTTATQGIVLIEIYDAD